jgi:hypothetical protein
VVLAAGEEQDGLMLGRETGYGALEVDQANQERIDGPKALSSEAEATAMAAETLYVSGA